MIRPLGKSDYDRWLPLWRENCEHQIPDDVTAETWRRLCDPTEKVFGLGAWQEENLVGILHYILHPTTGSKSSACYMQDLFIDPASRHKGNARALLTALSEAGKKQNWSRIYWLADAKNEAARHLYKNIAINIDFDIYIMPIQPL